ncbi:indole-3-acetate beta-glucosyltransferase isoform X3 [Zea mays]|uniref:Glycosyltransferase n=1 Tax=Zea mays TaxID=4577 RepID=A0A804NC26_MAIZE|nr:indole-3-acetate beta-glucosyltransferase isoform X3 [Zea mays]|eukprot:XP_008672851.1 indole-3-acetate beta-glucosyltransferase isoform X3 [Zea mays]
MAAAAGGTGGCGCHIVAVPFPGRGHVNAMMNLSRLLAARGAAVTFVVTEEWLGLIRSSSAAAAAEPAGIRIRTIPNVIPSEHGRAANHSGFLDAVATEMEAPFDRLLDGLEGPPPAALVADAYVPWVVGVGNRRGVPVWSLFPMSAAFFFAYYHFDRLPAWLTNSEHAPESGNSDQRLGHYIAGQASSSIRLSDLEPLIHNKRTVKHILTTISSIRNAQSLLFTTMYELEASVIDSLSFVSVSASQLEEIALGLIASEVRFLWILREQSPRVQELFSGINNGMILPWCEQLEVLCHHSVGGFMTHCGMNSTLEGVFAGVPMLALPLFFDQPIDGRLIVEEWKIGLAVRDWASKGGLIGREDIARAVKKLMSSDETGTKALRERALELKEASRRAVNEGGSSYCNLSSLMETVCTPK